MMTIPLGQAHPQWKALKEKEKKQGTKDVDKTFKLALGPTLDKFDTACKAGDRPAARVQAAKLREIFPKYLAASAKLKLAGDFRKLLVEMEAYVGDNLDACLPTSPPSGFKYMKQGNDGLCAFYALYHFTNGGLTKADFIKKAAEYYKKELDMNDSDVRDLVKGGNDPAVMQAFKLSGASMGGKDAYIVADVSRGHFWTVRKIDDVWWLYDGLKGAPQVIGLEQEAKVHVSGKQLFA